MIATVVTAPPGERFPSLPKPGHLTQLAERLDQAVTLLKSDRPTDVAEALAKIQGVAGALRIHGAMAGLHL